MTITRFVMRTTAYTPTCIVIAALGVIAATTAQAKLCPMWDQSRPVGVVQKGVARELSGMVFSRKFQRLYLVNDSGNRPEIIQVAADGSNALPIAIRDFDPDDVEALSIGPCPSGDCIYVGDIGDNDADRDFIRIARVMEHGEIAPDHLEILDERIMQYPDRPHNAEAMAVHPNGDIIIVTKDRNKRRKEVFPAAVYKLPASAWIAPAKGPVILNYVGQIDVPTINAGADYYGKMVTDMTITPDGKNFVLLTYSNAIEFALDLSTGAIPPTNLLRPGVDYRTIPVNRLEQQEAIASLPDGSGFVYSTEVGDNFHWIDPPTELFFVRCLNWAR